jgi:hypothetical protein
MTLLLVVAGLALVAWLSQLWDERERRKSAAEITAALQETEARCRAERDAQASYPETFTPDPRSMNAGHPIVPRAESRNHRRAA